MKDRVAIRQLPTGVPGLDQVLGGGLPEFSFNVIGGAPFQAHIGKPVDPAELLATIADVAGRSKP